MKIVKDTLKFLGLIICNVYLFLCIEIFTGLLYQWVIVYYISYVFILVTASLIFITIYKLNIFNKLMSFVLVIISLIISLLLLSKVGDLLI